MLDAACSELARMIVKDGEGATRFIAVTVKGSRSFAEADRAARAVANSSLVKTALHGGSANWGRMMAALGYSGARVKRDLVDVYLCGMRVARNGAPTDFNASKLSRALQRKEIEVVIDLNSGDDEQTVWTCDLSAEYVEINK
jgi:glutamate N-acetyltransferase/amino-acid N-acetyltransferase